MAVSTGRVVAVFLLCLQGCLGYSSRPGTCEAAAANVQAMSPAQNSGTGGFFISFSHLTYNAGETVTVTVSGPSEIKGILLYGTAGGQRVGSFTAPNANFGVLANCGGGSASTIGHTNASPKGTSVSFSWTAPTPAVSEILFSGVVALAMNNWYIMDTKLLPQTGVSVSPSQTPPPTTAAVPQATPNPGQGNFEHIASLGDKMTLRWAIVDTAMHAEVEVAATGYVGFGFGKSMVGSEAIIGRIDNGAGSVSQYDLKGQTPSDIVLQPKQDLTDMSIVRSSRRAGQTTTMRFTRPLNTGDSNDAVLTPGSDTDIVWSFGATDALVYHGSNRGQAVINLGQGGSRDTTDKTLNAKRTAHAVLMCLCFALLLPLGIMTARFGRGVGGPAMWFNGHRALQVTGVVCAIVAFIIALVMTKSHFDGPGRAHKIIGVIVIACSLIQVAAGILRPHKPEDPADKKANDVRAMWLLAHRLGGLNIYVLSIVTIFLGLVLAKDVGLADSEQKTGGIIIIAVLQGVLLITSAVLSALRKPQTAIEVPGTDAREMTDLGEK